MAAVIQNKMVVTFLPKTGSTWIEYVLLRLYGNKVSLLKSTPSVSCWEQHIPLSYFNQDLFKAAWVRHPTSWWRSYWSYKQTCGWDKVNNFDCTCRHEDFHVFIDRMLEFDPGHYERMAKALIGFDHKKIDFVGRYENLVPDLLELLKAGVGDIFTEDDVAGFKKMNVSSSEFTSSWYRDESQERDVIEANRNFIDVFYRDVAQSG